MFQSRINFTLVTLFKIKDNLQLYQGAAQGIAPGGHMKFPAWIAALMTCATLFATHAFAQSPFYCERHFYNDSNVTWTLSASGVDRSFPPHSVQSLHFIGPPVLQLHIKSPFYDKTFSESWCHIDHSGNTGYIAVNEPTDGDITTCGAGWSCPSMRRHHHKKH